MLALSCKDPSWKHLFTSLTTVKLIPAILVAASNALVDRGGQEVGKSLKAFIRHPVICLCVTGNRGLVHDVGVGGVHRLSYEQHAKYLPAQSPWHRDMACRHLLRLLLLSQSWRTVAVLPSRRQENRSVVCLNWVLWSRRPKRGENLIWEPRTESFIT